jgi:hypothetical protein
VAEISKASKPSKKDLKEQFEAVRRKAGLLVEYTAMLEFHDLVAHVLENVITILTDLVRHCDDYAHSINGCKHKLCRLDT